MVGGGVVATPLFCMGWRLTPDEAEDNDDEVVLCELRVR